MWRPSGSVGSVVCGSCRMYDACFVCACACMLQMLYRVWVHSGALFGDTAARGAVVKDVYATMTRATGASCFYCDELTTEDEVCFAVWMLRGARVARSALIEAGYKVSCCQPLLLSDSLRIHDPLLSPEWYDDKSVDGGKVQRGNGDWINWSLCAEDFPASLKRRERRWFGRPAWGTTAAAGESVCSGSSGSVAAGAEAGVCGLAQTPCNVSESCVRFVCAANGQ